MQDEKPFNWPGAQAQADDDGDDARDLPRGPEVFRNWLNRAPVRRRASFDPSLYTWKGYRQWKEGVSRAWTDQDD